MTLARTAANVRPINPFPGDVVNDVAFNGTITAGQVVYHNGTGWQAAVLESGCDGKVMGIALQGGSSGNTGKDVLLHGRVTGWTGLADGTAIYTAAAGEVDDQAHPQYAVLIGYSVSDTDIFFMGALGAAHGS